jgi:hypothetical protein
MIKFAAAALWICAATVGAVFYSYQVAGQDPSETTKPLLGGLDYVDSDIISVPLIRDAAVQGYFLTKLVFTADPSQLKKLSVPAKALLADHVYSYLYSNPQLDFTRTSTLDLDAFRKNIRDSVNERVGAELVHDVLVDQVNFLSRDEIRDNAVKRRQSSAEAARRKNQATQEQ